MMLDHASNLVTSKAATSAPVTSEASNSNLVRSEQTPSNLQLILYNPPGPTNLLEYINLFNVNASTRLRNLYASTNSSRQPNLVTGLWEDFQGWMRNRFEDMLEFADSEVEDRVRAARQRQAAWLEEP